ncbi:MAG: DUF1080 domain-containing protein [Chitinophagaceae bacterium]|nr:DUF1080 domain-containing protein [Chitinophagaceae bacterium]
MRQILLIVFLMSSILLTATAQTDDNRTVATKIADLLAKLPADDAKQLGANAAAVAGLGEAGITELVKKLDAGGDVSRLHYAISGFSFAATQPGKESWRSMAVKAYGAALPQLRDSEAKLFILTQLEQVGKDDAIPYLEGYLKDERFSDPAARALATINSEASNKTLLAALANATGNARLSIVQALGDTRYREAAQPVAALAASDDAKTAKVALYTLARIGDPASEKILADAAAKSGYTYSVTDAAASYLLYLSNLAANGNAKAAEKAAGTLLKKATADNQVHTRTAALKLLSDIRGASGTALLTGAMKDKNAEYREAALKYAQPYINEANTPLWLKTLSKARAPAQAEIIRMLGNKNVAAALPVVLSAIQNKDAGVRLSAITAAAQIGGQEALPALLGILKTGSADEIAAAKSALLSMKGSDVVKETGDALNDASPAGKAAIIEVLGARAVSSKAADIIPFASSADPQISNSAKAALKQMVTPANLKQVYPLLLSAGNAHDISDWQQVIVAGISRIPSARGRNAAILTEISKAPADKKSLFYNVLSGIGDKEGLAAVAGAFASGNDQTKKEVIGALSNWKSGLATTQLYQVLQKAGKGTLAADAFTGFVKQISISKSTDDLKLIMLRDAMEYAQADDQKKAVLNQVGKLKTFPAFLYAGSFLDDPSLKREAANAAMNIAMADKSIYGANVRQVLEKAVNSLGGAESEYQREALHKHLAEMPKGEGFVPIFNSKDLTGWKGLVADPIKRAKMDAKTLAKEQAKADEEMRNGWSVKDGLLIFNGHGNNLCTNKKYGDFEMYVDWKITKDGDAGIYLRGTPQVQVWDTARVDVGAQVGSGGLYNNQKNESKPLVLADNAIGDWNTFRIQMVGDLVTVYLNGVLVVNGVPLENYWDRSLPIFPEEQIELQAHGTYVAYRDIYIREIPRPQPYTLTEEEKKEGYKILFDGTGLHEWVGNKTAYIIEDGNIAVYPKRGGNGNLYTKDEYSDFAFRFEFKLTPGANNGVGIRTPLTGDAAYEGMEIQVLDDDADIYKDLKPYQYHGSVYGIIPSKRGHLKPLGEWNEEEIRIEGSRIRITLNGTVIVEGDIAEASKDGTADHRDHPGLKRTSGHIGFLGHGDTLFFRNIRVKDLTKPVAPPAKSKTKKK